MRILGSKTVGPKAGTAPEFRNARTFPEPDVPRSLWLDFDASTTASNNYNTLNSALILVG